MSCEMASDSIDICIELQTFVFNANRIFNISKFIKSLDKYVLVRLLEMAIYFQM